MPDREQVIKGLESIHGVAVGDGEFYVTKCSMGDFNRLLSDALALLKAQEAVEPKVKQFIISGIGEYDPTAEMKICGNCDHILTCDYEYCPRCGRKVKWE